MAPANSSPHLAKLEALSEREKETLRLLFEGHDAKSIARTLGLSVHTVNERLRVSRRKLEVSSSREAARLLAHSEQDTPNSLVDKRIGVVGNAVEVNNDDQRIGRKGLKHPLVLAVGGTLIMSFIIATVMLTWAPLGAADPGPLPNWSTAATAPARMPRPTNTIRLDGNRLLWNGEETGEAAMREFLNLVTQMSPAPLTVLSYSANAPVERVHRVRLIIDEEIRCKSDTCLEIILPPA